MTDVSPQTIEYLEQVLAQKEADIEDIKHALELYRAKAERENRPRYEPS